MSPFLDRLRSRTAAFVHDLLSIPLAWLGAYWLRFNLDQIPADFLQGALLSAPLVVLIQGAVYWALGLYRGVWRFASLPDLGRILKAVVLGTLLVTAALFILNRSALLPRSVPVLYLGLQLLLLAGPRLLYRWLKDRRLRRPSGQRVLIVGAGRAGEMLVRDMLRDPKRAYCPVGFVDDKPRRQGAEVHGVPVLGASTAIPELVRRLDIDLVLLAVPSARAAEMRRLVALCEAAGRPFRTVPELGSLMRGEVGIAQLRPVSIEDLLGRDPVQLDWSGICAGLAGRAILLTGAGGSIGAELCRQLAQAAPERVILVDHSEFNLYRIHHELAERHPELRLARYLLDVTDVPALRTLFARERPAIVFHAAAYKHVPMLEDQIRAAVRNNVLGTRRLAEMAAASGCERFVLISTDKAVRPANVMGATKRLAERLCQALDARSSCRFMTVRFGNVLGSAGSVVPLFRRQIEAGGPLTLTHPEIERYFMTIPEACQLIMQAAVIGTGGEIFVLDMGEPVRIRDLAEQMIRLSGREPEVDISLRYIGLRPGEKLYEELFYADEALSKTHHPKIWVARTQREQALDLARLDILEQRIDDDNPGLLAETLHALVPEWCAPDGDASAQSQSQRIEERPCTTQTP